MSIAILYRRVRCLLVAVVLALSAGAVAAAERQMLHGHVPARVRALVACGQLDPTTNLQLAIGLPVRNAAGLASFLRELQDPASPNYRQFLTPEQFADRFGATEQDYEAVVAFAQTHGLTVTARHPNRLVLSVRGTARDIEGAFHVTLRTYHHPTEARTFHAPDMEPSVDLAVPILQVSGLDNFALPHPHVRVHPHTSLQTGQSYTGSGPGGGFIGSDFRRAYVPGTTLNGAGQNVGLLQFDGYYARDITNYMGDAGIPPGVILINVPINGGVGTPGPNNIEVCLDIEMVLAMAPGISKIYVYEAPNPSPWVDLLSRMANDNLAQQLSCSWGGGPPDATAEQIFQQMAAQGQSFFNASGDSDAFTGAVEFPAESTNIVQVGGTTLTMSGSGSAYSSETVWNKNNGVGSSGGISTSYAIPGYQQGVSMAANQGSTTMRNIPDVALTADNVYIRYDNGSSGWCGGTSAAAPLWAGFTALVNQQAASNAVPPVGFLNPAIYAIGKGANYAANFHDTTVGDNCWSNSLTQFTAAPGYDLCTGWGTPNGVNLINTLAAYSNILVITPSGGVSFTGPSGGPFWPASTNLFLTNSGVASISWGAGTTSIWLTLAPSSGTLLPGRTTNVAISLTTAATSLVAQTYNGTAWFTNNSVGSVLGRPVSLQVLGPEAAQNGGFETGDLTSWSSSGNFAFTGVQPSSYKDTNYVHSGTYAMFFGAAGSLGFISQTLQTVPNRPYLLSFWLRNPSGVNGLPNEFRAQWGGVTLFDQTNIVVTAWTNVRLMVSATAPTTLLSFGGRNDPDWFALDDVSVLMLATPALGSMARGTNVSTIGWSASTNVYYQPQYTTNLIPVHWVNLGAPILGTGGTMRATDSSPDSSQRFYRVILQP